MSLTKDDFEEAVCAECGSDAFAKYYKIYRLSALKSPQGKEENNAVAVYACANCGKIYNVEDEKSVLA